MLVDVRVILLVEDNKTIYIPVELETLGAFMYMMVINALMKRWTLTLPKFDEPFEAQFHFEKFWGNQCWSM